MKDFKEIFDMIEDNLVKMDEKVNEKLSELYDKLDGYRDTFKKNSRGDNKTVTVDIEDDGQDKTVTVTIDQDDKKSKKKDKHKKRDKLVEMAPFLDDESLHELVVEFLDGDLETEMDEFLPFLAESDIALLVNKFKETGTNEFKGLYLEELFPFASDVYIDELFMEKFLHGDIDESLIPFVSDKCWHELVVKYCEDEESELDIDAIYPFLDKEDLNLLFKTYLKRRSKKKD